MQARQRGSAHSPGGGLPAEAEQQEAEAAEPAGGHGASAGPAREAAGSGNGALRAGQQRRSYSLRPIRREAGPGDRRRPMGAQDRSALCAPPTYQLRTLQHRLRAAGQSPPRTSALTPPAQSRLNASHHPLPYCGARPHGSIISPCSSQSESASFIPASTLVRAANRKRLLGGGGPARPSRREGPSR